MSFPFQIIDHIIPGQQIREYPHSTKGKQETPHDRSDQEKEKEGKIRSNEITDILNDEKVLKATERKIHWEW